MIRKLRIAGIFIVTVIAVANPIATLVTWLILDDKFNKGKK